MNNRIKQFNENGYDVLIYISDQHTADCAGFMGDRIVRTPNLDSIAKDSIVCTSAYTSCPLCVPARASFLTSRMPSNIGVFDNACDFASGEPTFAHTHALKGYETNLIGRMHFVGMDFYHGFMRRIGKDMTSSYWGMPSEERKDLGDFGRSLYQKHCLEIVGSGDSPVLAYDREVVSLAEDFFDKDYEKPQMTVVGTYAPHFPYVADEEKMSYYRDLFAKSYVDEKEEFNLPPVDAKVQKTTKEDIIELRAAYYAMVETMDEQIGRVYKKYSAYLKRNNRKGIFIYMSDHGDQLGYMGIYGKQTFFEKSAKIPLLIRIDDFGRKTIDEPISIMDIAPTLCEINKTEKLPLAEGVSFSDAILGNESCERYAISEFYDGQIADCVRGYMVVSDGYKLITYGGYEDKDLLFNLHNDKSEKKNLSSSEPMVYNKLKAILAADRRIADRSKQYIDGKKNHRLLDKVGNSQQYLNEYTYSPPKESIYISDSKKRPHREW